MNHTVIRPILAAVIAASLVAAAGASVEPQTSARMERAKDFIADEQWLRAIQELKVAAADAKEKHQDEALFWLAHSQHQAGDLLDAVNTVAQLEKRFPVSRWVKPARSLRVELAQKMRRSDVLWWTATTAPSAESVTVERPTTAKIVTSAGGERTSRPTRPAAGVDVPPQAAGTAPTPPVIVPAPASAPAAAGTPVPPRATGTGAGGRRPAPRPSTVWVSEFTVADTDLRIQALGSLIQTDAQRVIPILREIALESGNPGEASRAVFVLAQSGRADAHSTVLEVAKRASEPVSVAAVRELGRFGGAQMANELLEVYEIGKPSVKYQVVTSLGERSAANALYRIVQSESDSTLRDVAIITLGRAGGREQLQRLYRRATPDVKGPIIRGLFNARADDELIEIAEREKDPALRRAVLERLQLLGTPKAKAYLEKRQTSR